MYALVGGKVRELELPSPETLVVPGVRWGTFDEVLSPAYWKGQAWQHETIGTYLNLRLGRTLFEEVAACLLGGYGMPAELGLEAFARLRDWGLLSQSANVTTIEAALAEPFSMRGRLRRYRFPRQKATYLARCLFALNGLPEPESDVALRDALAQLPGIGLKTASWVVRNYRASDSVAVIDVHILRAGTHIGLFPTDWKPARNYRLLEKSFLEFAHALQVSACILDGLIWDYMRRIMGNVRTERGYRAFELRQQRLPLFSAT